MRITGRRPKRSDQAPRMGEKINCMRAHANPKYPVMAAAWAMFPPSNRMMRLGRTGAIMPKARKSNRTVARMKANAARLGELSWIGAAGEDTNIPLWKIVTGKRWRRKQNESGEKRGGKREEGRED